MKKFMVSVVAAVCVVSGAFAADGDGMKELNAVKQDKSLGVAGKVAAYKDIARRYPALGAAAASSAAWECFRGGDADAALAEADAGIAGYPGATNEVVSMFGCKSCALNKQGKHAEAVAVLSDCMRDYPTVGAPTKASFKYRQANIYFARLNDPAAAVALLREAVDLETPGKNGLNYSLTLAKFLKKTGAGSEVTGVCQAAVLKNAAAVGGTEAMERAFNQVDPVALGVEKYREFLNGVLLRVPAVEANAKFLGRVKSELEKVK